MFVTTTTQVWKRLYDEGKLNESQSHFWRTKPAEELYDLEKDPDEVNNLAGSQKHQEILAQMRKAHRDHVTKIRDVGFLPEGEIHSRSEGSTPYEMGHDDKKYPFEKVYAAADLASSMRKTDLFKITELLGDPDSAVRYWGALGLVMQEKAGVKKGHAKLLKALSDKSPYVRVIAAEALGKYGSKEDVAKAVDTLGKVADPIKNGCFPSMLAMNAIDHLDDKSKSLIPLIQSMPRTPTEVDKRFQGYVGRLVDTTLNELGATSQSTPKSKKKKDRKKDQKK